MAVGKVLVGGGTSNSGSVPLSSATGYGGAVYTGTNKRSDSNGFYSEGLNSLGWTSMELDISTNGNVLHYSINPGTSIKLNNVKPGDSVSVTGTVTLSDGTVRPVMSDVIKVSNSNNVMKLYCQYKFTRSGSADSDGSGTYLSKDSIPLPVAANSTVGGKVFPFAGWKVSAAGLCTDGNYYAKGASVPAGEITGDIVFLADHGYSLEGFIDGTTPADLTSTVTLGGGKSLAVTPSWKDGASHGSVTPSIIQGDCVEINASGNVVAKIVESTSDAIVRYNGTTEMGVPYILDVALRVPRGNNIDEIITRISAGTYSGEMVVGSPTSAQMSGLKSALRGAAAGSIDLDLSGTDITSIEYEAFHSCSSLTSITIPSSVTSIGNEAFSYCSNLTGITIPSSVTSIGVSAFHGCSRLTGITIPSGVTSIKVCAFYGCSRLTNIDIPSSVTSIGNDAFSYCSSLTGITIPSSVTSIGVSAFYGCSSLTAVTFGGTKSQWNAINIESNSGLSGKTIVCTDGNVTMP